MSDFTKVKKNFDSLKLLSNCPKKLRNSVIKGASKELIDTICECILNFLNGNLNVPETDLEKLVKHKSSLRKLLKRISLKEKKKVLIQKGGFLQILLPSIITGLASIISSAISKE